MTTLGQFGLPYGSGGPGKVAGGLFSEVHLFGCKRLAEGRVKIENIGEVFDAVILCFAEDAVLDEIEDNISEVLCLGEPPFLQKGVGHRAKLLEGIFADAVAEFLTTDVALIGQFLSALAVGLGLDERFPDKAVSSQRVAWIISYNKLYDFLKVAGDHYS